MRAHDGTTRTAAAATPLCKNMLNDVGHAHKNVQLRRFDYSATDSIPDLIPVHPDLIPVRSHFC
jgi:hypothetical protein